MAKRSEGVKRIVLVLSVLSVFGWISFVGIAIGFSRIEPVGWLVFAVSLVIVYFVPQLICRTTYWVMDGFKKDKET